MKLFTIATVHVLVWLHNDRLFFMQIIRKENMNRVDDCHHVMLKYWMAMEQATPTWSALIEALESEVMGRRDIAREIQSQYNIVKRESSGRGSKCCFL